jgi:KaiC/GvpD/RAD55 family RecA-like ATPase
MMFEVDENMIPKSFGETSPVGIYGVKFLDDYLVSINKKELILIGAGSGCGKSTLAQKIAVTNAKNGVKVGLFSLENSKGDTLRKEIYNEYKRLTQNWDMSFRQFNLMIHNQDFDSEIYEIAEKQAKDTLNGVWLYEKPSRGFTIDDLKVQFDKSVAEEGCKIIIIDHLDYFDQLEQDRNDDCKFIRILMKMIRELMERYDVPVVAFSQFRKPTDQKMIIPTQYEFYGSSDKAKIATTVVVMARNYEDTQNEADKYKIHTYIAIRKDRFGMIKMADCVYNLRLACYTESYRKGNTDEWGHIINYD